MCPSCFCTTLCNLAGIWLSHLKEQIVQPHIQAAPFSVKGRKIAGSTQKLLYFAFHVCFHLCALQLFKMTGFTQPTQIYFLSIFSFFFFFSSSIFFFPKRGYRRGVCISFRHPMGLIERGGKSLCLICSPNVELYTWSAESQLWWHRSQAGDPVLFHRER